MKKVILLALLLSGCTASSSAKFQQQLGILESNVAAINATIANVSPQLAKNCGQAQSVGQQLLPLVQQSSTANSGLATVNAGITAWCQNVPTDIPTAIVAILAVANQGYAAYRSASTGK